MSSLLAALLLAGGTPASTGCPPPGGGGPPPPRERTLTRAQWLPRTIVTEYYPAPERWFRGRAVAAPGLPGRHRVDWLYSSSGLAMEGDGVGLDSRRYHFAGPYTVGWVDGGGGTTRPCASGSWTGGRPSWLAFGWRNAAGAVTFPLEAGGWSSGSAARSIAAPPGLRFGAGPSLPLRYWRSAATDRRLIPSGSRLFIPAYCATPGHGWFLAQDTGGAIIGRHVDVYRPPPLAPAGGRILPDERVFVIPAGAPTPARPPSCVPAREPSRELGAQAVP